ncbi:MAG: DNA polymerase/3'-5' exonuclease PolX [Bacteroidota bacterium]|nr:DNA polymerase/3'-5' exonuclease PolX [Bacteroidota bacterium]
MTDNAYIADQFSLLSKLMDIHGGNSFKSKSYAAAAFNIEKLTGPLNEVPAEKLSSLKGIGDSAAKKITEILETGKLQALEDLILATPPGVLEMLNIKGLGPKKIATVWKEMEIESLGELLYACEENRLLLYKGFGEKTQANVKEAIEYYLQNQGSFLYAEIEALYPNIKGYLEKCFGADAVAVTGNYRRQDNTIDALEFVIGKPTETIKPVFQTAQPPELLQESDDTLVYKLKNGLRLHLHTGIASLPQKLFLTTGPASFTQDFQKQFPNSVLHDAAGNDDTAVFSKAGLPYIPPCLRDIPGIIDRARNNALPTLIQANDIRGIIHSHSNWSDGSNTIEEMAKVCIDKGYEYLVISDHSKSAFYANGLQEERIREQHRYVDELNARFAPFTIFKSIECDILNDGNLDYSNELLSTFDLVIASVHSNLKMTEEKAMMRLLNAINNPYTTILGHMTGRLLLSRRGYPVDHTQVIEACAANDVVIELNAHPRRLDIDWSWIDHALAKQVMISIDPDAHSIEGYDDCKYGVLAAQKGGLTREKNLSSFSLDAFRHFISERRKKKRI